MNVKISFKNSLKIVAGLLMLLAIVVSCEKEGVFPDTALDNSVQQTEKVIPKLEGVSLVDGRLVFESESAYNNAKTVLRNKEIDAQAIIKEQFPSFVSIEDAYNNITEEERERISITGDLTGYENIVVFEKGLDGEVSAELNTGAVEKRLLVNSNGFVQIGDDFKKMEYYNTYTLSKNQYETFLKEGKVRDFLVKESNNVQLLGETGVDNTNSRSTEKCTARTDGKKKRVKGKVQYASGEIYAISKHQKRVAWIWWSNKASSLSYSGTASWTNSKFGAQSWNSSNSCSDCNKVDEAIFIGWPVDEYASNISFSINHRATSGGKTGSCDNNN